MRNTTDYFKKFSRELTKIWGAAGGLKDSFGLYSNILYISDIQKAHYNVCTETKDGKPGLKKPKLIKNYNNRLKSWIKYFFAGSEIIFKHISWPLSKIPRPAECVKFPMLFDAMTNLMNSKSDPRFTSALFGLLETGARYSGYASIKFSAFDWT